MGNILTKKSQNATPKKKYVKRQDPPIRKQPKEKEVRKKSHNIPSAYALFLSDVRRQLSGEKVDFKIFSKSCAQKWRDMSPEEKEKYKKTYRDLREKMKKEGIKEKRRTIKDPKTRKKTNFWNFAQKIRPVVHKEFKERTETEGKKPLMKDVNREVGIRWRQLTPDQKNTFKTDL